jgi:hypothetical protein
MRDTHSNGQGVLERYWTNTQKYSALVSIDGTRQDN